MQSYNYTDSDVNELLVTIAVHCENCGDSYKVKTVAENLNNYSACPDGTYISCFQEICPDCAKRLFAKSAEGAFDNILPDWVFGDDL